ncbi:MAG: hypothetical protein WAW37_16255 [Syntrophobacteraceae bacterium]
MWTRLGRVVDRVVNRVVKKGTHCQDTSENTKRVIPAEAGIQWI